MNTTTTETTEAPMTVTLRGGVEVLAKSLEGRPWAYTFANRTQAEKHVARLGAGWTVYQIGRPFFVGKVRS